MDKTPKYFLNVTKSYENNGKVYVVGVASGTLEDQDQQRMSKGVLQAFADVINSSRLPLTNGHPKGGPIDGDLGILTKGQVVEDAPGVYSLVVEAELDMDNPSNHYMLKKINEGKRFAFSVEGMEPQVKRTWSERLNQFVDEFVSVIPKAISITTQPSYLPSFLDVVTKAYDKKVADEANALQELSNINNHDMANKKPVVTEAETTTEAEVEVVATTETTEAEVVSENVETLETTVAEAEDLAASVVETEVAPEQEAETDVEKAESPVLEAVQKVLDQMSALEARLNDLESGVTKNLSANNQVLKSVFEDVEAIKGMPLRKKSVVAKSYSDVKQEKPTLASMLNEWRDS